MGVCTYKCMFSCGAFPLPPKYDTDLQRNGFKRVKGIILMLYYTDVSNLQQDGGFLCQQLWHRRECYFNSMILYESLSSSVLEPLLMY